jgi:hypothetical protein
LAFCSSVSPWSAILPATGSVRALVRCKSPEWPHCPQHISPRIATDGHSILTNFNQWFGFNQCYICSPYLVLPCRISGSYNVSLPPHKFTRPPCCF